MPSLAFQNHLVPLLADVRELDAAHARLRTGIVGRQWRLGALNRASVVIAVSAWESYIENVLVEAIDLMRPAAPPLSNWQIFSSAARTAVGRFNNPNPDKVRELFRDSLGIRDITSDWYWAGSSQQRSVQGLNDALTFRHQIAHGTNPRPIIINSYASWLPGFMERLGTSTDRGIRNHLQNNLGMVGVF